MQFDKIHNKGQARLFQNPLLEALTKTHPVIPWVMFLPFMVYFLFKAYANLAFSPTTILLYSAAGLFTWTLVEYIFHRFLFHLVPQSETGKKISYIIHGNHHHYPRDRQRLFMPPVPLTLIALALFGIQYAILGEKAFMFFPGFNLGYLLYGTMHYAIHAWNPPFAFMKPLWRNHHLHHYKDEHRGFGVSTTLWDRLFGTMWDLKKEKEDKDKVQALMFEKRK